MKITTTAGQLADLLGRVVRAVATRSTEARANLEVASKQARALLAIVSDD